MKLKETNVESENVEYLLLERFHVEYDISIHVYRLEWNFEVHLKLISCQDVCKPILVQNYLDGFDLFLI